jgi:hypothetical protein
METSLMLISTRANSQSEGMRLARLTLLPGSGSKTIARRLTNKH